MKRRVFLGAGAAALAAGCARQESEGETANAGSAPASAPAVVGRTRELRCVTTWPKNFPGLGEAPERIAQFAEAMSGGSLKISVFAAGELVPAFEAFDAVASGAADAYHGAEYYWQGKAKGFSFFTSVPMGLTATDFSAWIAGGGGQELWDDLAGQFGIKPLMAGNTGHQAGGWFKREINSIDDFRGLRMRIPGLGGEVVRGLGGAAVALPGGEIYPALQSGAIDATEWVGPWNDRAFGFQREAKLYYLPGFHEPGSALSFGMNLSVWEELSPEHQAIITHACASAHEAMLADYSYYNAVALEQLVSEDAVEVRAFPDEVWAQVAEVSEQVLSDVAASDPTTQAIYDSFVNARRLLSGWTSVSDAPYLRERNRVLAPR